jgi:molecular chaperone HtpG
MYSDPYVVYREYIQNATDSIDDAFHQGLLNPGEGSINIDINPSERRISIFDNGCGVPSNLAVKTLISIGNSRKDSSSSRGFRGIGRLSALSYCSKLTFETSYFSEKQGTRIVIDSKRLSELLAQVSDADVSVLDVLQQVYSHSTFPEKAKRHYFRVIMDGVDIASDLTNVNEVISYISQNAPVPYDKAAFPWGYEITQRIRKEGFVIQSYNIFVSCGNAHQKIYKPYKGEFLSDKGKQIYDKIHDIEIVKFNKPDGTVSAIGWIAKTSFLGSIYDKSIKGLRMRKGNILIGDQQTLNVLFKDARFNGWSIGEIFAVDSQLIPNARRDNFEKNAAYFSLIEQMMPLAAKITKTIRSTSATRNHELSAALKAIDDVSTQTNQALSTGVSSSQKGTLHSNLSRAQNLLGGVSANGDADAYFQEIAFEELDMLIGRIKGATSYKALNTIEHLSTTEKHILERVFNILISADQDNAPQVIDTILEGFAK